MNITVDSTCPITLPPCITVDVPLHDKNWFGTGGKAQYFAQPQTAQEFQESLAFGIIHQLPLTILGAGANVLIADEGLQGLVIRPYNTTKNIHQLDAATTEVTFGAGVSNEDAINYCLANNLIGLEEFSGIPGTIGGSVFINIHYFEHLLSTFLVRATVIDLQGNISTVDNAWFKFGYNFSTLHDKQHILIDATFKFTVVNPLQAAYAQGRSVEIIRHRFRRYPHVGTCGSFFRNFFDHEVNHESNGKKMIYVAYYLDKLGVKGTLRVGGAQVSHQHANMLVNTGSATSTDLVTLARTMQEMVQQEFGITPQPECQLLGFTHNPLL